MPERRPASHNEPDPSRGISLAPCDLSHPCLQTSSVKNPGPRLNEVESDGPTAYVRETNFCPLAGRANVIGGSQGAPQFHIHTRRHLWPCFRAGSRLTRFPPALSGQLILQGVQVPHADRPLRRHLGLLHTKFIPGLIK